MKDWEAVSVAQVQEVVLAKITDLSGSALNYPWWRRWIVWGHVRRYVALLRDIRELAEVAQVKAAARDEIPAK
jgi:hypothetical protein